MFQGGYSLSSAAGHKGPLEKPQDEKRPEFKPIPGFKELLNIRDFLLFFLDELSLNFPVIFFQIATHFLRQNVKNRCLSHI